MSIPLNDSSVYLFSYLLFFRISQLNNTTQSDMTIRFIQFNYSSVYSVYSSVYSVYSSAYSVYSSVYSVYSTAYSVYSSVYSIYSSVYLDFSDSLSWRIRHKAPWRSRGIRPPTLDGPPKFPVKIDGKISRIYPSSWGSDLLCPLQWEDWADFEWNGIHKRWMKIFKWNSQMMN